MAKRAKGTGTLRKRTDGRWEGRLYFGKDENGKNQYKTVTSKKKENAMRIASMVILLIRLLKNGIESTSKIFAQDT